MKYTTNIPQITRELFLGLLVLFAPAQVFSQESNWVARSNQLAKPALDVVARFAPESAAQIGVEGVDEEIIDIRAGYVERQIKEFQILVSGYQKKEAAESDKRVRYDLRILIGALEDYIESLEVNREYMLPYHDLAEVVFFGINNLMAPQVAAQRRPSALTRLQRYAGQEDDYKPITYHAKTQMVEALKNPDLIGPFYKEIDRHLTTYPQYMSGIRELFEASELQDWQDTMDILERQMNEYYAWVDGTLRARARLSSPLPVEVYKDNLKQFGVQMDPEELIRIGTHGFKDIQNEMSVIAALIAENRNYASSDYREVIRALKKEHRIAGDKAVEFYQGVLGSIEDIIRRNQLVTLPQRKAGIEFASKARSAATPAPFMEIPRMLDNTGQYPIFMIPHLEKDEDGNWPMVDTLFSDFAWSLTAHEARPGHEMQFSAMIENGVSHIRAIFAMNSANAEGWGLYAEAIMKPYFSLEAQLMSLQMRLMRAARMFLDPMINTGLIDGDTAYRVITEDVMIDEQLALQEVQRYSFRSPGQATAYYYGYHYLQALRAETEILLADNFVQKDFHDFILAQGMLPPQLMKKAVMENFVGPRLLRGE